MLLVTRGELLVTGEKLQLPLLCQLVLQQRSFLGLFAILVRRVGRVALLSPIPAMRRFILRQRIILGVIGWRLGSNLDSYCQPPWCNIISSWRGYCYRHFCFWSTGYSCYQRTLNANSITTNYRITAWNSCEWDGKLYFALNIGSGRKSISNSPLDLMAGG